MEKWFIAFTAVGLLALLFVFTVFAQEGGVEFNVINIVVPSELFGSFQSLIVPLNVSDIGLLSEWNVYVVSQGVPRVSYLFSRNPPIVVFVEPSIYSGRYEVWYGGKNPYSQFTGTPGSAMSFWLVYDDFDYATDFWVARNVSITGSRAFISPGGYLALNTSYSHKTVHMWLLHGRRALVLSFTSVINEFVALTLTSTNFTDIDRVLDGLDVYFLDSAGNCLYYSVIHFDKTSKILVVTVNSANNTVIYMLYGGVNECPAHRV